MHLSAVTIQELTRESGPERHQRSGRCHVGFDAFDEHYGIASFRTNSTGGSGTYDQEIQFLDWELVITPEDLEELGYHGEKILRELKGDLKNSDVKVWCSCPDFSYMGFAWLSDQFDYGVGKSQGGPPNIRNPKYRGALCKHLIAVLKRYF